MAGALWYPPNTNRGLADPTPTDQRQSDPQGWDAVRLGGYLLRSKAKITRGGARYKVDRKQAAGRSAARPTVHGYEEQEVEIEVQARTNADREATDRILFELAPRPGGRATPVTIEAEALSGLPITHVQVVAVGHWSDGEPGHKRCSISCIEWRPEDKADNGTTVTHTATAPGGNARTKEAERRGLQPKPPTTDSKVNKPNFTPSRGA